MPQATGKSNQRHIDVYLGELVAAIVGAMDDISKNKNASAEVKNAAESLGNRMWVEQTKSGKGHNVIAYSSATFRRLLLDIIESPIVLFSSCRRVKFMLSAMDVASQITKKDIENRAKMLRMVTKITSDILKAGIQTAAQLAIPIAKAVGVAASASGYGAAAMPVMKAMGSSAKLASDAAVAIVSMVSSVVTNYVDAKAEQEQRLVRAVAPNASIAHCGAVTRVRACARAGGNEVRAARPRVEFHPATDWHPAGMRCSGSDTCAHEHHRRRRRGSHCTGSQDRCGGERSLQLCNP